MPAAKSPPAARWTFSSSTPRRNTQVDKVRELIIDNVKYAPTRGRYKVYIVDEVHMLSTSSFNALLKTLEEPPEHVKFVFATTDVQKVPTTILSRCQRFDLKRIPAALIARICRHRPAARRSSSRRRPRKRWRAEPRGMRDAESMLDQLVAFCGDKIDGERRAFGVRIHGPRRRSLSSATALISSGCAPTRSGSARAGGGGAGSVTA